MIPKHIFERTLLEFFAPIRPFLEADGITEIMINGPDRIYIERGGVIHPVDASFESYDALVAGLRNLAQYVGRHFDAQRPILEARLPDGSRVEAIMPPAAPDGPTVAIRRFHRETLTVHRLIELGSVTQAAVELLAALVQLKLNVMVSGGTGSGKTSFLNVLSSFCPESDRIVVIEDSRELQLQQEHVVQLEAQPGDPKGRGRVTIRQLFAATLRMRPDRIVIGEIRGGESLDLIQAMTSGHGGCMSTVHASTARDTMSRLETLAMMSDVAIPLPALRAQAASAIDIIVTVSRQRDGSRCVSSISEVLGYDQTSGYRIAELFARDYTKADDGEYRYDLVPTGVVPSCDEALRAHGLELPAPVAVEPLEGWR